MFVIVAYDVNQKRNRKIHKLCRRYLYAAEESVFEGVITEAKLAQLKQEIKNILVAEEDTCIIYKMNSTKYCSKDCFGKAKNQKGIISTLNSG